MGYCARMVKAEFRIPAEQQAAALAAVKALIGSGLETCKDLSGPHFAWVRSDKVVQAQTLEDAIAEWGWQIKTSGSTPCPTCGRDGYGGAITGISFEGETLGDETVLFGAIARFVADGSYIEMCGEDGVMWRWCFEAGRFSERQPKITWS